MRQIPTPVIVAAVFLPQFSAPAVLYAASHWACVTELHVPQYPSLARQARLTGVASVSIEIGDDGEPKAISVKGVHRLLEATVTEAVRASRFSAGCKGQTLNVQFIFELEGPPKPMDSGRVLFRPPDVFVIRAAYFPISGG